MNRDDKKNPPSPPFKKGGMEGFDTIGFKTYFIVWICLIALTVITVTVASLGLGKYGSLTSVFIASLKATLILLFFMHLKYERFLIKAMLLVTIFTIAVIIGLTFFDIGVRYK